MVVGSPKWDVAWLPVIFQHRVYSFPFDKVIITANPTSNHPFPSFTFPHIKLSTIPKKKNFPKSPKQYKHARTSSYTHVTQKFRWKARAQQVPLPRHAREQVSLSFSCHYPARITSFPQPLVHPRTRARARNDAENARVKREGNTRVSGLGSFFSERAKDRLGVYTLWVVVQMGWLSDYESVYTKINIAYNMGLSFGNL